MCKRRMKEQGRAGRKDWNIANNGEIIFTYEEAKKDYEITAPRFKRALQDLVEKGFLDVSEYGTSFDKKPSKYYMGTRWEKYGKPDFESVTMPKRPGPVGFGKTFSTNTNVGVPTNVDVSCENEW